MTTRTSWSTADVICHWCQQPAGTSPYRSMIEGVPGARWVVCSPDCSEKPDDAVVFPYYPKDPWTK